MTRPTKILDRPLLPGGTWSEQTAVLPLRCFSTEHKSKDCPCSIPMPSLSSQALIKRRDKRHEQRIKLSNQHSVIIEDLAPGQEVLTQDYLSGLWKDSAVVLSKRDDVRSYWVRDNQGRSFTRGRRRLKAVSQSADNPQETATNHIKISISRVNIIAYLNQLFAQLCTNHLSYNNNIFEISQASVFFIYLTASSLNPASTLPTFTILIILKGSSHVYNITSYHRTLSSHPLAQMVSLLDLLFPRDPFGAQTKSSVPESQQSAHGKNIQEVSYQEGSKDHITHTESSGFYFIENHHGTVRAMFTLIIIFGLLLCFLRFLRFQFLRRQQLRNLRERFLRRYQNPDGNVEMQDMAGTYRQHPDMESGRLPYPELHGGHYPTAILSQRGLHRNLQRNIARSTFQSGSRRPSSTPRSSPIPSPGRATNLMSFTWENSAPRRIPDRVSPPPSPLNMSQSRPTPARRLRGGLASKERQRYRKD